MLTHWEAASTLDRMLDDVMGSMLGTAASPHTFTAAIDVRTGEDEVVFVCDVPGVKHEDIEITVENRVLTIKGTRKFEGRENEQILLGRAYGSFERSFNLSDAIDDSRPVASLADGVLTVRFPKHAKAKPRRIPVAIGPGHKQLEE